MKLSVRDFAKKLCPLLGRVQALLHSLFLIQKQRLLTKAMITRTAMKRERQKLRRVFVSISSRLSRYSELIFMYSSTKSAKSDQSCRL